MESTAPKHYSNIFEAKEANSIYIREGVSSKSHLCKKTSVQLLSLLSDFSCRLLILDQDLGKNCKYI